jgi:hypothetical protein
MAFLLILLWSFRDLATRIPTTSQRPRSTRNRFACLGAGTCHIHCHQRYEGGSTIFGPFTLVAYMQELEALATALATGATVFVGLDCLSQ